MIDRRSLRPVDVDWVLRSVAKTNRLVIVEEEPQLGGWAAGLLLTVTERALDDLDDAWVLSSPEIPVPYSPTPEARGRLHGRRSGHSSLGANSAIGTGVARPARLSHKPSGVSGRTWPPSTTSVCPVM